MATIPLERVFGLATLRISAASHAGSSGMAGSSYDMAKQLVGELAGRAAAERGDAT